MEKHRDLTGHWVGFYVQYHRSRGLSAELVQSGERLSGSMRDHETQGEATVGEIAAEANLPPGGDEQIVAWLRQWFPDAPSASMRHFFLLPPDSTLEGRVDGREVYFLKTYQGPQISGYKVGEQGVGFQTPKHQVHYRGRVALAGGEIEGKWWIDPPPGTSARHRTEGTFVLRQGSVDVGATAVEAAPAPAQAPRRWWQVLGWPRPGRREG